MGLRHYRAKLLELDFEVLNALEAPKLQANLNLKKKGLNLKFFYEAYWMVRCHVKDTEVYGKYMS
ncbi:MAG: hypothetical protein Ct9H300mP20_02580 [Gammaproteobacteria bacterium]|nr:MAG: hypothetical protein Ct9H300mP20_02580 [Gammaproteobacteria bacterium]